MAELRDPKETGSHVNRVASCAVTIYEHWAASHGVSREKIDKNRDVLRMSAMLHDVGKVAISDSILKKPARFTPEEFEIMKGHTYMGARLFADQYSEFDEESPTQAILRVIFGLSLLRCRGGTGGAAMISAESSRECCRREGSRVR